MTGLDDSSFVCLEPDLPSTAARLAAAAVAARIRPDNATVDGGARRFWARGATLSVRFLDLPHPSLLEVVMDAAAAWLVGSGLGFDVVARDDADIRITFDGAGNWSMLGTEAAVAPAGAATMCLAETTRPASSLRVLRIVRHEFGHALGLRHEGPGPIEVVQSRQTHCPDAGRRGPVTVRRGPAHRQTVLCRHRAADHRDSIMVYPAVGDGRVTGYELSRADRRFVRETYRVCRRTWR